VFGGLLNETLTLRKKSTGHLHQFRALVNSGKGKIYTDNGRLPVEEGDLIERPLPTSIETYTVVDRGYFAAIHGTPAHYQMKVRKNSAEPKSPRRAGPDSAVPRMRVPHFSPVLRKVGTTDLNLFGTSRPDPSTFLLPPRGILDLERN
jgi:hypothetical protein